MPPWRDWLPFAGGFLLYNTMAKRFIDTNLFNDEWVCNLSKDSKLFFIYYIVTCDHAGVLRLNKKLCEFQTGIKSFETIIKEFGNSLITVKENVFFMPKFIKFQYPNFPNSGVKQQDGALRILESLGITKDLLNSYLTLKEDLNKSYVIDSVSECILEKKKKKISFIDSEIYDKNKFKVAFSEWTNDKLAYYYESALTWSNEGNKKIDWIATIRTWANRDEKQGKIKFTIQNIHNNLQGTL
jgi:hypothetical protein